MRTPYVDPQEQGRGTRKRPSVPSTPQLDVFAPPPSVKTIHNTPVYDPAQTPKERGINQSDANASARWKENALRAVRACCNSLNEFTTDDVWAALQLAGADPLVSERHPTAMGGVMLRAAKLGWIAKTGRVRWSTQTTNHQRDVTIWAVLQRPQGEV